MMTTWAEEGGGHLVHTFPEKLPEQSRQREVSEEIDSTCATQEGRIGSCEWERELLFSFTSSPSTAVQSTVQLYGICTLFFPQASHSLTTLKWRLTDMCDDVKKNYLNSIKQIVNFSYCCDWQFSWFTAMCWRNVVHTVGHLVSDGEFFRIKQIKILSLTFNTFHVTGS